MAKSAAATRIPLTTKQRFSGLALLVGLVLAGLSGGWGGVQTGVFLEQHFLTQWPPDQSSVTRFAASPATTAKPAVGSLMPLAVRIGSSELARLQQQQAQDLERQRAEAQAAEQQRLTCEAPAAFKGQIVRSAQLKVARDAIALTFDDGPWDVTTAQILDILQQEQVKATFFWVGQAAQSQQELARRVVNAGHAIGNHSWHHPYDPMDPATAAHEIDGAAQIFHEITGIQTSLFRPPGGYLNNGLSDYALAQGYTVVLWSSESRDTDYGADPQAYVNSVLASATPGGIVLMHDGGGDRSGTVAALPAIIRGLKAQGYRFVTVPELLKLEATGW